MSYSTAHGDWNIPARSSEGKARAYLHQLEAGWGLIHVTESDTQRDPLTLTRIGMDPTKIQFWRRVHKDKRGLLFELESTESPQQLIEGAA